ASVLAIISKFFKSIPQIMLVILVLRRVYLTTYLNLPIQANKLQHNHVRRYGLMGEAIHCRN
ncbi:MAG TPA: hypothetical protein DCS26_02660, partial [Porticoccaceae bacterium]|nr:hypothetical protein [Porticoccaceae bacterium]